MSETLAREGLLLPIDFKYFEKAELEELKMKVKPKARRDLMAAAAANLPKAPAA